MRISEKIKITNDMVKIFSELSGDKNPIHLDNEYAKKTIFGKRIVHGMLLSSFFSKLIATDYPGEGSIYLQQNLKFNNPCYIDDEIEVVIELDNVENNKYLLKTYILKDEINIVDGYAVVIKKNN
jgi:3-hydroxybutyryl-CoA dehydratase